MGKPDNALIIFLKNPVAGMVKTRLAADIGDEKALQVYRRLVMHTFSVAENLGGTALYYFYSESIPSLGDHTPGHTAVQHGKDLGERILNAFETVKQRGHSKICIIGTDCPELSTKHLVQAFDDLQNHDLVIGPAADGGYYLLGLKKIERFLFMDKQWSTSIVLESTLESARQSGLTVTLLPELRDLDNISDLVYFPDLENPDFRTGDKKP